MKKIAYLQCPTGIAGDMFLGALVSAGVPFDYLREQLDCLGIGQEYQLRQELVHRNTQQGMKIHVDLIETEQQSNPDSGDRPHNHEHNHSHHHPHEPNHEHDHGQTHPHHSHRPTRHLPEIEALIQAAQLPKRAETWSLQVFQTLAVAEGAVHGIAPEQVHFHEVGATDAIVDIVGTCLGLDWLGIEELYCSPLPTGGGTVWAAHGRLPVPVPAVLSLFQSHQVPVYSNGIEKELVTPTGAAIAVTLATAFGNPPSMTIRAIGLGAGSRDLPIPNILRLWVGESTNYTDSTPTETISVLETQIDDANPQAIAYTLERLFAAGALDAFTQAIVMKKSRTGVLLTVICHPEQQKACEAVIFRETPTLGIRISTQQRSLLHRELHSVSTPFGEVRVKVATDSQGKIMNVQPEYEDCAEIARSQDIPWQEVHRQGLQAWYGKFD